MISSFSRGLFRIALLACLCALGLAVGRYAHRPRPAPRLAAPSPANRLRPPLPGTPPGQPAGTPLPSTAGLAPAAPPPPPIPRPPRGTLLALLYGANRNGEVEPCG